MTTVAAIARQGLVHMAADTMTNVYDRPVFGVSKILRLPAGPGAEMLVGVCGDGALDGVLRSDLKVKASPAAGDDLQAWASTVARAITEIAGGVGLMSEGRLDGSLLLGFAGRVWTVVHAQAVPHHDGVAAIGSGEGPAIGAVDALLERGVSPPEALESAVRIAIARDRYSGAPIQMELLRPPAAADALPAALRAPIKGAHRKAAKAKGGA